MSNLRDAGFRYVYRCSGDFTWVHPAEVLSSDVDCTDMDDEEFERFVVSVSNDRKMRLHL